MTLEQVHSIVQKYAEQWNRQNPKYPLWVALASPGDPVNIPGATFGTSDNPQAGMELPVCAHVIVINKSMVPESILTTFTHEYGHLNIDWPTPVILTMLLQKLPPLRAR